MSHLDDTAQAVDPKCIDIVIDAAAPEKAQAWRRRMRVFFRDSRLVQSTDISLAPKRG
jgi:hypothetical protein